MLECLDLSYEINIETCFIFTVLLFLYIMKPESYKIPNNDHDGKLKFINEALGLSV